ncbi:MFS transporter [Halomonas cupida]|uniref:MFS transporter n=1 Tax=Halomonas cupida TaxID=44933 RepID=A0A1M7KRV9_9GAMM|nr:MFS transporter [Halomonas cupida]GEN25552.1 MFS transporter [Halomonas cupida]SHM68196.1 Predicted arabinose efflux permease, MFS family [Halomonas cupida]
MTEGTRTQTRQITERRDWLGVVAVMVGIFLLVTAEQLPIGLLSQVSTALNVSPGIAGLMITVPGVVAAFSAPLLPVAVGRLDRRWMLTSLMALMTVASLLGALADSFALLLATRVLVGVCIGGFWAIAGGLASRLVALPQVPRAMAIIFSGVAGASVLGVPAGTWLGEQTDWRIAFIAMAIGSGLVTLALWWLLPPLPASQPVRLSTLFGQFSNRGVRVGVYVTSLIVVGHFAAYTFISPILQQMAGVPLANVSTLLLLYGGAGLMGNFLAGTAAGRNPWRTVLVIPVVLAIATLSFPGLAGVSPLGTLLLMLWGAVFGSISVSMQTWILRAAPNAEAATALMAFVFNMSIGFGAMAGGQVVDGFGLSTVLYSSGALFVLAALIVLRTPATVLASPSGSR